MKLDPTEIEAARLFTAEVKSIVRENYPDNPLHVIGSHSTGLADRLSDFDFSLSFPDLEKPPLERGPSSTRPFSRKVGQKALRNIFRSLDKSQRYQDIEIIHARVPIVKAIHRKTQLKVELQTMSSSEAAREYTLYYLAEFPTLRPLYILFRSALHLRKLNIVFEGGLGSYSVLIMIVNALKHASGKYARDDLVNHFLHVLDFYSTANLYKYGFSPDPPRTFRKGRQKMSSAEKEAQLSDPMLRGLAIMRTYDPKRPYLLCLQDPANAVNDLGCRAYGIKHVQELFKTIRKGLITNMKAWDGDGQFEEPWHSRGLLAPFLAANYVKLREKRQMIHQWVMEENPSHHDESSIDESSVLNDQVSRTTNIAEQLANTDVSPLDDTPNAEEVNPIIIVPASEEVRMDKSNFKEKKISNTRNYRQSVKTADQSNATSTLESDTSTGQSIDQERSVQQTDSSQVLEPMDIVKGKPESLQGDSTTVEKPSQGNEHQIVIPRGWKKWVPSEQPASEPQNNHQNPKAKTGRKHEEEKRSAALRSAQIRKLKRKRESVRHFVPNQGDQ